MNSQIIVFDSDRLCLRTTERKKDKSDCNLRESWFVVICDLKSKQKKTKINDDKEESKESLERAKCESFKSFRLQSSKLLRASAPSDYLIIWKARDEQAGNI